MNENWSNKINRLKELEFALGSPNDENNHFSFARLLQLDESENLPIEQYKILSQLKIQHLFVPEQLGGNWRDLDELIWSMRSIFRRDSSIALGFGVTSLMAALPVWHSANSQQKQKLADSILSGNAVSIAFHEPAHGNDLLANEFKAQKQNHLNKNNKNNLNYLNYLDDLKNKSDLNHKYNYDDDYCHDFNPENNLNYEANFSFILNGQKNIINNVGRAYDAIIFVKTSGFKNSDKNHFDNLNDNFNHQINLNKNLNNNNFNNKNLNNNLKNNEDSENNQPNFQNPVRSYSLIHLDQNDLQRGKFLARTHSLGARSCELRGWKATDLEVSGDSLIGEEGLGFEITAKVFQITRAVLPSMAIGIADTAWRLCYRFLSTRNLYDKRALDLPLVQRDLSSVFIDLVCADVLSLTAARMAHVAPKQLSLASSIAKVGVPSILSNVMKQLSVLLGARHYVREGDFGFFQKLLRDCPVVSIGHASSDVCLSLLISQLPTLAQFSRLSSLQNPQNNALDFQTKRDELEVIFKQSAPLPALRLDQLQLSCHGRDWVLQNLSAFLDQIQAAQNDVDFKKVNEKNQPNKNQQSKNPSSFLTIEQRLFVLAKTIKQRYNTLIHDILARPSQETLNGEIGIVFAKRYVRLYAAACLFYCWHFNRKDVHALYGLHPFDLLDLDAQNFKSKLQQTFDLQMMRALEQQLQMNSVALHLDHPNDFVYSINQANKAWIENTLQTMKQCAEQNLSVGLLRLPYAKSSH